MTPKDEKVKETKPEEKKAGPPKYYGLNIHQRLHAVMKDIDYVQKEKAKEKGLKYNFVSHDAVTAICRKSFVENGVLTIPTIKGHTTERCTRKKKIWVNNVETLGEEHILMTTLQVEIEFINIDKPEEKITTVSYGYGLDDQDKGMGKAYSYAVKYGYLKALGLETGDDPEREEHEGVKPEKAIGGNIRGQISEEQEAEFYKQALSSIEGAADWESLKKVWANQWKTRATYTPAHFADIQAKYDERKTEFPESQANGAHQ